MDKIHSALEYILPNGYIQLINTFSYGVPALYNYTIVSITFLECS